MSETRIVHVDVDPGDPHNDQLAARAAEDLHRHVVSARDTLAQGNRASVVAVIATVLHDDPETFPRDRLAALLAAALVELAETPGGES